MSINYLISVSLCQIFEENGLVYNYSDSYDLFNAGRIHNNDNIYDIKLYRDAL